MSYTVYNGTSINNFYTLDGILNSSFSATIVNPYSGYTFEINRPMYVINAVYNGGGGSDTISMSANGDYVTILDSNNIVMLNRIESFFGNAGDDIIILADDVLTYQADGLVRIRGNLGDDILWGNTNNDLIFGEADNDHLDGGPGDDQLFGGDQNDFLHGGAGTDSLLGGTGNDILAYHADAVWTGFMLSDLNSAIPFAALVSLDGYNRSYDLFSGDGETDYQTSPNQGIDTLIMTSGNDALIIGDTVSPGGVVTPRVQAMDIIEAGDGHDIVDMTGAAHAGLTIDGGAGDDILGGTADADTIKGGTGADRLFGGQGADILEGGADNDAYYYNFGDGSDILRETQGTDSIVFGAGIAFEDIGFTINGEDLLLTIGSDTLTIEGHFAADLSGRIESLVFDDASTFDLSSYTAQVAPVAVEDSFSGDEDTVITGNLIANDTDENNDVLEAVAESLVTANGASVTINTDGTFTYSPLANFNGADSFIYTVRDPSGAMAIGSVLLSVAAVNDTPLAYDDAFSGLRGAQISGDLLADNGNGADSDVDGDTLEVVSEIITTANGATVVLGSDGTFTYDGAMDFFGVDSFQYTVSDGNGGFDTATASITVALNPADSIIGTQDGETIHGTDGDDEIFALDGNDTAYGKDGNDRMFGGAGDDVLYGDDGVTETVVLDKVFNDIERFPTLVERTNIQNLLPPGTPALGIAEGNLSVSYDATASITFRKGKAGFNNSLGSFAIAEDGTLVDASMHWANVKTAGVNVTHQIDLPTGPNGGAFGFFIIANGDNVNAKYTNLDITGEGNIHFIYNYGKADQRAAKITDDGKKISAVYDDGVTEQVLKGKVYFTTERGESASINHDGKVHVVSGLNDVNNLNLSIKRSDLASRPETLTKNGITLDAMGGRLVASGDKVGIRSAATGGDIIAGNETLRVTFAGAEKVRINLSDIAGNGTGIDFKVYLNGDLVNPVSYEHAVLTAVQGGKLVILLDAAMFGGGLITGVDISSVSNSALKTETFWLDNIIAEIPGGLDTNTLRIGFEDLPNTGDADYEDVLFDLDINPITVESTDGGQDYLNGGAGNDSLYGEGGDDILVIGLGADQATGGAGADLFLIDTVDALRDTLHDFNADEGDMIDISSVLEGFDPLTSDIANFVQLVQNGADAELRINADGTGDDFVAAALIVGGAGLDLATLTAEGTLVTV